MSVRYLVTGGAGFIGSHVVDALVARGPDRVARVDVLDALTYAGDPARLTDDPRVRLHVGDVCDAPVVAALVAQADVVLHLAAESHVDRSIADGRPFATTNVVGTQVLLDAVRDHPVTRVVHVGTDEVHGSLATGRADEDAPLRPSSAYAASKAAGDLLALAAHHTHGVPVCVTRATNAYGPRQHPEKVVARFTLALLRGEPVGVYGDGRQVREWLHVTDHARALLAVADRGTPGRVYNLGGGTPMTNLELTAALVRLTGADPGLVRHVADRPGHDARYALDGSRLARELGVEPQVAFEQGLADTVAWYRAHPDGAGR